jgi:hypothetical protein
MLLTACSHNDSRIHSGTQKANEIPSDTSNGFETIDDLYGDIIPSSSAILNFFTPDGENIQLIYSHGHQLTEDGIFLGGDLIRFLDFSTDRAIVLCSQPGCTHSDSLCPAFIGSFSSYALYHDAFFALTYEREAACHYTLKTRVPQATIWKTLWNYKFSDEAMSNVVTRLGGGYAAILVNESIWDEQYGERIYTHLVAINLESGFFKDIMPKQKMINSESYLLLGAAEGYAILLWTGFNEEVIQIEDYVMQAIEDNGIPAEDAIDDWFNYLEGIRLNRLLSINLATGNITEVASGSHNILPVPHTSDMIYNGVAYFQHNGAIMAYNVNNNELKELRRVPNIINVFAYDGRVFYITLTESNAQYFFLDLETGICYQLMNDKNNNVVIITLHDENSNMFIGLHHEGRVVLIEKEHFYDEYYYRAIKLD